MQPGGGGRGQPSLQRLLDAFVALAWESEPDAIALQAVDLARGKTRARYGAAVVLDGGQITTLAHQGLTRAQVQALPALPIDVGALGAMVKHRMATRTEYPQGPAGRFPFDHVPTSAYLAVPVVSEDTLRGALLLAQPPGHVPFGRDDELFVRTLARQTALALHVRSLRREVASTAGRMRQPATTQQDLISQARDLDQIKLDFVSMASHELRTPLTSILGFASTILAHWDSTPPDQLQSFVEIINRQAQRLARLINALLASSQIEAGTLSPQFRPVDVAHAIESAIAELGAGADEVTVRCHDGLAARADPEHFQQILVNYLRNALKYGGVAVVVEAVARDGWVELVVRDGGPGVPESFVPRLFEKFAQAERATMRPSGGTGLGLALVRGLAEAQQGEVWYEPGSPTGACFGVRLVLAAPETRSTPGVRHT